ncbi:hypothetical protein BC833DRAFT_607890 [Globomyces pollinis-pini]|nr:hypothetical protein BC833DRAFT_607890 [Globomyces pollinis-pini]
MILRLSNPNDTRDLKSANLNEYLDMIYRLKSKVQNRTILQSKIKSFHRLYQTRTSIQLTLPLLKQANEYDDITNFLNCFPKEQFQTLIINYNSLVEYPLESLKIINFISTIFNSIHSVYMNSFPRDKTFEIIPYLSRLPIKKLHHSHSLGDQDIKEMVKILEKNQIESLYLCERKLSNATITVLLNALSNTTQLREVNFEGISMNAHTLYLMSKCIELNWNLKKLNIVTEELKGTEEFYNTIANHEHLQYLQLSGLISCEENVKGIQRVLQTNSTRLVGLKIHDSSFTDHDLSEIMKSLINHRFLEVIEIQSLQSQRFHKTSFQLYEIIKRNKILKQLLVMNLELNGDNIRRIFTALTQNTTLELLYFDQR